MFVNISSARESLWYGTILNAALKNFSSIKRFKTSLLLCELTKYVLSITVYYFLFHDLLSAPMFYHSVWSVITAHNLTPAKRDVTTVVSDQRSRFNLSLIHI